MLTLLPARLPAGKRAGNPFSRQDVSIVSNRLPTGLNELNCLTAGL